MGIAGNVRLRRGGSDAVRKAWFAAIALGALGIGSGCVSAMSSESGALTAEPEARTARLRMADLNKMHYDPATGILYAWAYLDLDAHVGGLVEQRPELRGSSPIDLEDLHPTEVSIDPESADLPAWVSFNGVVVTADGRRLLFAVGAMNGLRHRALLVAAAGNNAAMALDELYVSSGTSSFMYENHFRPQFEDLAKSGSFCLHNYTQYTATVASPPGKEALSPPSLSDEDKRRAQAIMKKYERRIPSFEAMALSVWQRAFPDKSRAEIEALANQPVGWDGVESSTVSAPK